MPKLEAGGQAQAERGKAVARTLNQIKQVLNVVRRA